MTEHKDWLNQEASTIVDSIADLVQVGNRRRCGWKYPAALVVEAVERSHLRGKAPVVETLRDLLRESFDENRFNYFDQPLVPDDLDTASAMTRIFMDDEIVVGHYDDLINRNTVRAGIVTTWLDTSDHHRWHAGDRPYHVDVLLNHWLTQVALGREVDLNALHAVIAEAGLTNYWYVPCLYTAWLYSNLLEALGLHNEREFTEVLIGRLEAFSGGDENDGTACTSAEFREVKQNIGQWQVPAFNRLCYASIAHRLESAQVRVRDDIVARDASSIAAVQPVALYWTVGFRPYGSTIVSRALEVQMRFRSREGARSYDR